MGRRLEEPQASRSARTRLFIWCGAAVVVILAVVLGIHLLHGDKTEDPSLQLQPDATNTRLMGVTGQYTFDIPADMADMLKVAEGSIEDSIVFYCVSPDGDIPAFQLSFDSAGDHEVGSVSSGGETRIVYAEMLAPPAALSDEAMDQFYAVQEVVNELRISANAH